jgi:phosphohistidine phosphatase
MHVYLIRHGDALTKAAGGVSSDAQRPLSPEGIAHVQAVARRLAVLRPKGRPVIWTSPLIRAVQTATMLADALGCAGRFDTTSVLVPDGEPDAVVYRLRECRPDDTVFAIGHQPLLGRVVSLIAFRGDVDGVSLRPAGVAWLELPDFPKSLEGVMQGLWTPEVLAPANGGGATRR